MRLNVICIVQTYNNEDESENPRKKICTTIQLMPHRIAKVNKTLRTNGTKILSNNSFPNHMLKILSECTYSGLFMGIIYIQANYTRAKYKLVARGD